MKMKFIITKKLRTGLLILSCLTPLFWGGCAPGYQRTDNQENGNNYQNNANYDSQQSDYDALDRYGEWFNTAEYGTVWRPYVNAGWQPFTYGHWMRTNDGWTWVSYEPFGWLVYHYGYWNYLPETGWYWIPDNQWAAARVEWINYGDYIGWAPMPPSNVSWNDPYYSNYPVWNIVDSRDFTRENIAGYRMRNLPDRMSLNTYSHRAPELIEIERMTKHPVTVESIDTSPVKVNGRNYQRIRLPIDEAAKVKRYRPEIERNVVRAKDTRGIRTGNTGDRNNNNIRNSGERSTGERNNVQPPRVSTPADKNGNTNNQGRINTPPKKESPAVQPRENTPVNKRTETVKPQNPNPAVKNRPKSIPPKDRPGRDQQQNPEDNKTVKPDNRDQNKDEKEQPRDNNRDRQDNRQKDDGDRKDTR